MDGMGDVVDDDDDVVDVVADNENALDVENKNLVMILKKDDTCDDDKANEAPRT